MLIWYFAEGAAVKATQQWCTWCKFQTFHEPPCVFQDAGDVPV
jgi:hypothetical protein